MTLPKGRINARPRNPRQPHWPTVYRESDLFLGENRLQAISNARPCVLEPVMELEIRIPEEYVGKVVGDLAGRRGRIVSLTAEGALQVICARVPARELHRYATVVQSLTSGQGVHAESFGHYEILPLELEEQVVKESARRGIGEKI